MVECIAPASDSVGPKGKKLKTGCAQRLDEVIGEVVADRWRGRDLEGEGERIDKGGRRLRAGAREALTQGKQERDAADGFVVPATGQTEERICEQPTPSLTRLVTAIQRP